MSPILSICIFTFDRANLLASALASLAPQVKGLGGEVELIVSDNCSSDNTREVVAQFASQCAIVYHRHDENIGPIRNARYAVENLASGEFCWLLGDDDMLRNGAVRTIVQALNTYPEVDHFYVNYSMDSFHRREAIPVEADDFQEWTRTGDENLEERTVDRWEELIADDFNALTAIYSSIFRRSAWLCVAPGLASGRLYASLDQTYPHAAIFGRTMVGKRSWASGYPWVIMCGKESWADFIPVVVLLRFHEVLDLYIKNGVDPKLLRRHRRRMLNEAAAPLARLVRGEKLPLLESFSVLNFLFRHSRYLEAWKVVFSTLVGTPSTLLARYSPGWTAVALPAKVVARCRILLKSSRSGGHSPLVRLRK